jgi:REP element-mobilizing transposase RayT
VAYHLTSRLRDTLAAMVDRYRVHCHAWVLTDNYYHLLVETPTPNLSLALRHLNGVYTQAFNPRHRRRRASVSKPIQSDRRGKERYLLELCRHVVLTPNFPRALGPDVSTIGSCHMAICNSCID